MSGLPAALGDYLAIRRALGFKLGRTGLLLADSVAHLEASGTDRITIDAALGWATLPQHGASA
jgi:integrase/recombinase XerD